MAAGITPGEAGIRLEPVQQVVDWARENHIRGQLGITAVNYQQYIQQQQREEQ